MAENKPKKKYQRADGTFYRQVYLGTKDGKAIYKSVYANTEKELEDKVIQLKLQLKKGLDVSSDRDTFEQWSERWLKIKKENVSAARYEVYSCNVKALEPLKYIPISKIKTYDIQEIIQDRAKCNPNTNRPMSNEGLKGIKSTAIQIFKLAVQNRVIDYNPAEAVDIPPNNEKSSRRALNSTEQGWIRDTKHRGQTSAMIMMYAGLRRGELIPLTWGDISLKNKTISVQKAVEIVDKEFVLKQYTKTEAGMRIIDIPDTLVNYLKSVRPTPCYRTTLVVTSAKGEMLTVSAWRRLWESYFCELNFRYGNHDKEITSKFHPHKLPKKIPPITAHWLRHTFITLMYLAGVDVLTAKAQAGHEDIKTTLEIYSHLDKQFKRNNMNKLNEYIAKQNKKGSK